MSTKKKTKTKPSRKPKKKAYRTELLNALVKRSKLFVTSDAAPPNT